MGRRGVLLGVVVRIGVGLLSFSVRIVAEDGFVLLPELLVLKFVPGCGFLLRVVGGVLCVFNEDCRAYCVQRVVDGRIMSLMHV